MYRISTTAVAALLASLIAIQPMTARADDDQRRGRRDRYEERSDRRVSRHDARGGSWSQGPVSRGESRYRPRPMGRNDRIYRGSDNRYYCKRDDGTTGLIIGGVAGGVLGHVIAPGGSKTLGTIIGAGAGALLGRAVDDGDIVCR